MTLVEVVVILVLCGVGLWLINTKAPLQPPFKTLINILVVVVVCAWLLKETGLLHAGPTIRLR